MRVDPASTAQAPDLGLESTSDQDVLIVTDSRQHGRDALAMHFRSACVLVADGEVIPDAGSVFHTIVIDRNNLDLGWLDATSQRLLPALRPGGRVVVLFRASSQGIRPGSPPDTPGFTGFRWHGLVTLNGVPGAVIAAADHHTAAVGMVGPLLATAHAAVRCATARPCQEFGPTTVNATTAAHLEARRQSEHALLWHLDTLARQLEEERQQHKGLNVIRTMLRRSRSGRTLLRLLRPAVRGLRSFRSALPG